MSITPISLDSLILTDPEAEQLSSGHGMDKGVVGQAYQVEAHFQALNEPFVLVHYDWTAFFYHPNPPIGTIL